MKEANTAATDAPPGTRGDLQSVCVFCGSGFGSDPIFKTAAVDLGRELARNSLALVYGGGDVGLMGTVARSTLDNGGYVTGIIPTFLRNQEIMLTAAQETIVVPDMHTRKRLMFERSDAFVALPGGIGTLEELVEQMTWAQLGQHTKPIMLVDIGGFWQPLLKLLRHMREYGFIRPGLELSYLVADTIDAVVPMLRDVQHRTGGVGAQPALEQRF